MLGGGRSIFHSHQQVLQSRLLFRRRGEGGTFRRRGGRHISSVEAGHYIVCVVGTVVVIVGMVLMLL